MLDMLKKNDRDKEIRVIEGKVRDIDYVFAAGAEHIQLKFEDGQVMIFQNFETNRFDNIKIGDEIIVEKDINSNTPVGHQYKWKKIK